MCGGGGGGGGGGGVPGPSVTKKLWRRSFFNLIILVLN